MFKAAMGILRFINEEAIRLSEEHAHFSFGENWKKHLSAVNKTIIKHAKNSFGAFTRLFRLNDYTFLGL
jgi:hypothetical protein